MQTLKYLHIGTAAIFFGPLIDVIEEDFALDEHLFILLAPQEAPSLKSRKNVITFRPRSFKSIVCYALIIWKIFKAEKVFLHGLFDDKMLFILFALPFWEKKSYWIAWGADLYDKYYPSSNLRIRLAKLFRKNVIRRTKHIVTYLKGDYVRAISWFGCQAEYHECFMYPSNLYTSPPLIDPQNPNRRKSKKIKIMIGNSADSLNEHEEIFHKIAVNISGDFEVHTPLAYGSSIYKQRIIKIGLEMFGADFFPMTEFVNREDYIKYLGSMDAIIFNHPIQQAMGNTITALGLGKAVFLREGTSQWELLIGIGITIYSTNEIHIEKMRDHLSFDNQEKVSNYFSRGRFTAQLSELFNQSCGS